MAIKFHVATTDWYWQIDTNTFGPQSQNPRGFCLIHQLFLVGTKIASHWNCKPCEKPESKNFVGVLNWLVYSNNEWLRTLGARMC